MLGLDGKKKQGMWKGRQGLAGGSEHNQAERDAEWRRLEHHLSELFHILREVESTIDQAGDVLRISQPTMIGKFALRWWKLSGKDRYIEPVVVRWMLQGNGVMTPKPATKLQARKNGAFALNHKETQECLNILGDLIKRRAELKKKIASISIAMRNINAVSLYLNNERERLEYLKSKAVRNLLDKGYEVEAALLDED